MDKRCDTFSNTQKRKYLNVLLTLRLAFRFILNTRKGSFSSYASMLTIAGLSIGITALMLTSSIIDGFQEVMSDKLSSIEGEGRVKHILGKPIDLDNTILEIIDKDSIYQINPYIKNVCMIRKGKNIEGAILEGVEKYPSAISDHYSSEVSSGEIILGHILAKNLDVKIGDKVFLQNFSQGTKNYLGPEINGFEVKFIFKSGLQEYDNSMAYISFIEAQRIFGYAENMASGLIINHSNNINFDYPFYFETWEERHNLLFEWITIQRWPAYIMFGLITLVGLVNLFATIAMIIIEKHGQIAILISGGLQKKKVRNIFMLQGAIIALFGSLIGGIMSLFLIQIQMKYSLLKIPVEIYFMDTIPFSFHLKNFVIIVLSVLVCSIIASWRSSKSLTSFSLSEILRYE